MIPEHVDRVLAWTAGAHLLVALGCALAIALAPDASPILGIHPALKPLKFGVSIAIFLATMAMVVPMLSIGAAPRLAIAIALSATMILEMLPIAVQAARGTTSHFNQDGQANTALWRLMLVAVVVMTLVMIVVALVATVRPLLGPQARPLDGLAATAWRFRRLRHQPAARHLRYYR